MGKISSDFALSISSDGSLQLAFILSSPTAYRIEVRHEVSFFFEKQEEMFENTTAAYTIH